MQKFRLDFHVRPSKPMRTRIQISAPAQVLAIERAIDDRWFLLLTSRRQGRRTERRSLVHCLVAVVLPCFLCEWKQAQADSSYFAAVVLLATVSWVSLCNSSSVSRESVLLLLPLCFPLSSSVLLLSPFRHFVVREQFYATAPWNGMTVFSIFHEIIIVSTNIPILTFPQPFV